MSDNISVRGFVATDVRSNTTDHGLAVASFRMCTTERRYDRELGTWVDGHTNWYSVSMFRQLAANAALSIHKGDRVVVAGRLKIRQWSRDDGRSGTNIDLEADTVGHDLMWGTASFRRSASGHSDAGHSDTDHSDTDHSDMGQGTVAGAEDIAAELGEDVDPDTGELLAAGSGVRRGEDGLEEPLVPDLEEEPGVLRGAGVS